MPAVWAAKLIPQSNIFGAVVVAGRLADDLFGAVVFCRIQEVDAKVEYQIDKNLLYYIEGRYFWPGDAYKNHDGDDADDAYAVRNGVILKF